MRPRRPVRRAGTALLFSAALAVASTGLAACGTTSANGRGSEPVTLTVFAASSLTGTFTALGEQYEKAHPGTRVRFSFGPSSVLATQITQRAPADVFASASTATMATVTQARRATNPADFATNQLQIAVPRTNPGKITSLRDLTRPGLKITVCSPGVPCGAAAQELLKAAQLNLKPASYEPDVKAALTRVTLGEADAGLVYVTDVRAARGKVTGIEIPAEINPVTRYPIAALTGSPHPTQAASFAAYVLSPPAQQILREAGFGAP